MCFLKGNRWNDFKLNSSLQIAKYVKYRSTLCIQGCEFSKNMCLRFYAISQRGSEITSRHLFHIHNI